MRATKAYIASLGTTGVLLGASILMLAVVSAVVAFDAWPNGTVSTRVQTLQLEDRTAPISVSAVARTGDTASAAARAAAAAGRLAPGLLNAQRVAGERLAGGAPATASPGGSGNPNQPTTQLPPLPTPPPIDLNNPDPAGTRNKLADQVQNSADSAGVSVGRVNPTAGDTVSTGGEAVADAMRQLPLPGPLYP